MSDLELDDTPDDDGTKTVLSDWMTRAELATELGMTAETLCRWDARRVGPAPTRVGRKVFYRRDTVRAWLLAQEQDRHAGSGRAGQRARGRR